MDCNFTLCKRYLNGNCIKQVGEKCQLEQAKEIIKNIIRVTWGEGWNYSLDVKVKAEQFLKENTDGRRE